MLRIRKKLRYSMLLVLIFFLWYATFGKKSVSTYIKSQFSPESIVDNAGTLPILVVIDATPGLYSGSGVHTIVELPAHTSTTDIGIDDPEGVLRHKDAYQDKNGIIRARKFTETLKTPAGSHVRITGINHNGLIYKSTIRGSLGRLLNFAGIHPKLYDSRHFSDGVYKRPKINSVRRKAYDSLAEKLPTQE